MTKLLKPALIVGTGLPGIYGINGRLTLVVMVHNLKKVNLKGLEKAE